VASVGPEDLRQRETERKRKKLGGKNKEREEGPEQYSGTASASANREG